MTKVPLTFLICWQICYIILNIIVHGTFWWGQFSLKRFVCNVTLTREIGLNNFVRSRGNKWPKSSFHNPRQAKPLGVNHSTLSISEFPVSLWQSFGLYIAKLLTLKWTSWLLLQDYKSFNCQRNINYFVFLKCYIK